MPHKSAETTEQYLKNPHLNTALIKLLNASGTLHQLQQQLQSQLATLANHLLKEASYQALFANLVVWFKEFDKIFGNWQHAITDESGQATRDWLALKNQANAFADQIDITKETLVNLKIHSKIPLPKTFKDSVTQYNKTIEEVIQQLSAMDEEIKTTLNTQQDIISPELVAEALEIRQIINTAPQQFQQMSSIGNQAYNELMLLNNQLVQLAEKKDFPRALTQLKRFVHAALQETIPHLKKSEQISIDLETPSARHKGLGGGLYVYAGDMKKNSGLLKARYIETMKHLFIAIGEDIEQYPETAKQLVQVQQTFHLAATLTDEINFNLGRYLPYALKDKTFRHLHKPELAFIDFNKETAKFILHVDALLKKSLVLFKNTHNISKQRTGLNKFVPPPDTITQFVKDTKKKSKKYSSAIASFQQLMAQGPRPKKFEDSPHPAQRLMQAYQENFATLREQLGENEKLLNRMLNSEIMTRTLAANPETEIYLQDQRTALFLASIVLQQELDTLLEQSISLNRQLQKNSSIGRPKNPEPTFENELVSGEDSQPVQQETVKPRRLMRPLSMLTDLERITQAHSHFNIQRVNLEKFSRFQRDNLMTAPSPPPVHRVSAQPTQAVASKLAVIPEEGLKTPTPSSAASFSP